ncbi:DUF3040 domain-containing protein [Prauserella muralis]|uniref:Uncharacterized protein n=1 Tax=Prauserella muralis TaxID=588067 RepID=A0A2V4BBR5_9PSEU|nr:DUF3040 domain-containing protein [Prauserella muralis]PXY32797.1 hypothetical protein BAY60_07470 [Prauserella muralis]TWE24222.1 DUF3040 family protein [Prauserella muralis]
MLSPHERQQLDRIEQWFEADDPAFADDLSALARRGVWPRVGRIVLDLLAAAAILVGLYTLDLGLVFLGLITAGGAAWLHLSAAPAETGPEPDREE